MSVVSEQVYNVKVDRNDVLYPLHIEKEIKLRSRVVLANKTKPLEMLFSIHGLVDGKFGRIERDIEIPEKTFTPDGDPIYRKMLDAFCKEWEKQHKAGNKLEFEVMLNLNDGDNIFKDIFKVE